MEAMFKVLFKSEQPEMYIHMTKQDTQVLFKHLYLFTDYQQLNRYEKELRGGVSSS